jgi:hypothetical protein
MNPPVPASLNELMNFSDRETAKMPDPDFGWHEKKYRDPNAPRVVQVILSADDRGEGTKENPHRLVKRVHDLDGHLIAESDPVNAHLNRAMSALAASQENLSAAAKENRLRFEHGQKMEHERNFLAAKLRKLQRKARG